MSTIYRFLTLALVFFSPLLVLSSEVQITTKQLVEKREICPSLKFFFKDKNMERYKNFQNDKSPERRTD